MKPMIRSVAVSAAMAAVLMSSGATASASDQADIWPCPTGLTCLYPWPNGEGGLTLEYGCGPNGQNFYPFPPGYADYPESVRSQGNAAVLGNYSGSGNTDDWESYDYNGGYVPAWSQINLERVWDAIIIKC